MCHQAMFTMGPNKRLQLDTSWKKGVKVHPNNAMMAVGKCQQINKWLVPNLQTKALVPSELFSIKMFEVAL